MERKPNSKKLKEEKERRALYDAIEGRLSEMHDCLKSRYIQAKSGSEESVIHGVNKGIHDIESIFWDVLINDDPAGEILKCRRKEIGTRICPV